MYFLLLLYNFVFSEQCCCHNVKEGISVLKVLEVEGTVLLTSETVPWWEDAMPSKCRAAVVS